MRIPNQSVGANRNSMAKKLAFFRDQIIPQARRNETEEDVCLDEYLECQLGYNISYPEEEDSPDNPFNGWYRDPV